MQCDTCNFGFYFKNHFLAWRTTLFECSKKSRKLCDTNWSPLVHVAAHQKRPLTKPQVFKYAHVFMWIYILCICMCICVCVVAHEDIHLNAFRWMNTCARHCVASLFKVNRLQILCALRFQIIQTHQASEKGA